MRNLLLVLQALALLLGLGMVVSGLAYACSSEYKSRVQRCGAVVTVIVGLVLFGLGSGLMA